MNARELRQRRAELIQQARGILNGAEQANRELTAEERQQYDALMAQIDQIGADVARIERLEGVEGSLRAQGMPDPRIGMSDGEVRRYSLMRAIRAAATHDWRGAELELEASRAVAQRLGREPKGFFVPYDWAAEARDLVKGTPSAGGYLVSTDLLAQSFIDLLRNRMVVRQAGATVLGGLVGDIAIPKQSGGATAYWIGEGSETTESEQQFTQVVMAPKTVSAMTFISRKLLLQSSIDVEAFVRQDLSRALALAIDRAALHGSGSSNEPTGVTSTSGIGLVVGGDNGAAPTWGHIVDLETEVAADNADVGQLAYITNAKVRGKLKKTPQVGSVPPMIWTGDAAPVNGYAAYVTNQVRSDLTKGTGTNLSAILFGNWADLIIGMWGVLDVLVDPYTRGASGAVRVITMQDVDIAVRHAESFSAMLDAITA